MQHQAMRWGWIAGLCMSMAWAVGCGDDDSSTTGAGDGGVASGGAGMGSGDAGTTSDAGSGGTTACNTAVVPQSFCDVWANTIAVSGCTGCHGSQGGLTLSTAEMAYTEMFDVLAESTNCTAIKRIAPGDPDGSLLILSVEGTPTNGCTAIPMPPSGANMAPQLVQQLRDWITNNP